MKLLENISLKNLTTIATGGPARFFVRCTTDDEINQALTLAKSRNLAVFTLGGGSNLLVSDRGFPGLVIQVAMESFSIKSDGLVFASAGLNWDRLVAECCSRGLTGLEAMSGIPGLVGATPIQNVGAYGQEVSNVISEVHAIDRSTLRNVIFKAEDCRFGYRQSRFKSTDDGKFIITAVTFKLSPTAVPIPKYEELKLALESEQRWQGSSREQKLMLLREFVLKIRAKKGMLLDAKDPDTRSVGSFFMNPIVSEDIKVKIEEIASQGISSRPFSAHRSADGLWKLSAAWLIESAGIKRGQSLGGARVSTKHVLALTNPGQASTREILALADLITSKVEQKYGIRLEREPVLLGENTSST